MSSETKNAGVAATFDKCSVVLVDVLGTTTSINFAKDTLFPFVTKNVEEILKEKWDDDAVKSAIKQLGESDEEVTLEAAVKLVKDLTESNSENAGLKTIQGIVYAKGYESGDLKAHVFADVPLCLESWAKSRKVAVYSTGSIDSQKQLFSKSIEGDLSGHVSKYFDQSVGPKTDSASYKKIAEELSVKPEEILFITDLVEEAKAAKTAGLQVAVVKREGNAELPEESKDFVEVSSFKEISFENSAKRKNVDESSVPEEPPSKLAKTAEEVKPESDTTKPEEKTDESMEVDAPKTESEKTETETKTTVTEKTDEIKPDKVEKKPEEEKKETEVDSTSEAKKSTDTVEEKEEKKVECTEAVAVDEVKESSKVEESTEVNSKNEEAAEVTKVEGEVTSTDEKTEVEGKSEEEKENKKDLANVVENGEKPTNGESAEDELKTNGDAKVPEEELNGKPEDAEKVEEVKVKKVDASATTSDTPAVSVEV